MIYYCLLAVLAIVCLIDIETKKISDGITLLGILVILNIQVFTGDIKSSILGLTAGFFGVWFMGVIRLQKLGGGDAKLMALIGSFSGWQTALWTIGLAFIGSKLWNMKEPKKSYAYSPYLTITFILINIWLHVT